MRNIFKKIQIGERKTSHKTQFKALQKGFSLPELIIVISIFVIISSVALFNQGKLSSSILLTNMAYEVGLAIREAQTYGIGVRAEGPSSTVFSGQYGAHFSVANDTSKRQVVVFADSEATLGGALNLYDPGEEKYIYEFENRRGNKIEALCVGNLGTDPCVFGGLNSVQSVDVLFKRPNPSAIVSPESLGAPTRNERVYIIITSLSGDDCRAIIVEPTGQIRVEDSSKKSCAVI